MGLTLILGPMKSGKSLELISYFAPLRYTNISFGLFQSARNVRDKNVWTRDGLQLEAKKIESLSEILDDNYQIVGIDEIHMFPADEAWVLDKILKRGCRLIVSGLDTDYRGKMFDIIKKVLELGPSEVRYRKAVCEICKNPNAVYTQLLKDDSPILEGLPSVLPEDGTYGYKVVCRSCFKRKNEA